MDTYGCKALSDQIDIFGEYKIHPDHRDTFEKIKSNTLTYDRKESTLLSLYWLQSDKIPEWYNHIKKDIQHKYEAFFERHINLVNWSWLSQNTTISEAFLEKHLSLVDWD